MLTKDLTPSTRLASMTAGEGMPCIHQRASFSRQISWKQTSTALQHSPTRRESSTQVIAKTTLASPSNTFHESDDHYWWLWSKERWDLWEQRDRPYRRQQGEHPDKRSFRCGIISQIIKHQSEKALLCLWNYQRMANHLPIDQPTWINQIQSQ